MTASQAKVHRNSVVKEAGLKALSRLVSISLVSCVIHWMFFFINMSLNSNNGKSDEINNKNFHVVQITFGIDINIQS